MSYSHSEVAHEFAHKTGEKQNGSNMFYRREGEFWTIYSYGSHFAIATLLPGAEYGFTALFTEQSYSNSTAKHKSIVSGAISHFDVVRVPENTDEYYRYSDGGYQLEVSEDRARKDLEYFAKELENLVGKHQRARKRDYSDNLCDLVENVRKYVNLFNCKHYLTGALRTAIYEDMNRPEVLDLVLGTDYTKELEKRRKAERRRRKQEIKARVQKFRNYESNSAHGLNKTLLRLSRDGSKIETSKSITIEDLQAARLLYDVCRKAREMGEDLAYNGKIARWNIDRVTSNGTIKAGCHTIPFKESDRIAEQKNWK